MAVFSFLSKLLRRTYVTTPKTKDTIEALWRLEKIILDTLDFNEAVQQIADSVLTELGYLKLGYRIVVLALVDEDSQTLKRISISQTEEAKKALEVTPVPFQDIIIPLTAHNNFCIKAAAEEKPYVTHDWKDILVPPYTEENARIVQSIVGIKTSMVYPVVYHGKTQGVIIFSMTKDENQVSDKEKDLIRGFTDVVGIAVQNAKLYTSVQKISADLQYANEKLTELDKLKDEFVSLASHELRTPMTAIKGSLATILDGYAGEISKDTKDFLTAAYNENDRLIRLVNNLLNISRIEAGRFTLTLTNIDMHALITEVVKNLNSAATEKHITLQYTNTTSLPVIRADEDKIKEVLINLIGNAIKFTHIGGVTITTSVKDGIVTVGVIDTGSGITPEDQQLLFKKFSQVGIKGDYAKPTGGTGLGLYICKQIVEGHNGRIWLESTIGKGSIFYFSLPVSA